MRLQTLEDDLRRMLIDYLYLLSRDVSQTVLETILRQLAIKVEVMRGCIPLIDEGSSPPGDPVFEVDCYETIVNIYKTVSGSDYEGR